MRVGKRGIGDESFEDFKWEEDKITRSKEFLLLLFPHLFQVVQEKRVTRFRKTSWEIAEPDGISSAGMGRQQRCPIVQSVFKSMASFEKQG